jgi:hypothetical protein
MHLPNLHLRDVESHSGKRRCPKPDIKGDFQTSYNNNYRQIQQKANLHPLHPTNTNKDTKGRRHSWPDINRALSIKYPTKSITQLFTTLKYWSKHPLTLRKPYSGLTYHSIPPPPPPTHNTTGPSIYTTPTTHKIFT